MNTDLLLAVAQDVVRRHIECGYTLEGFLSSHHAEVSKRGEDAPSVWVTVGGSIFPVREGGQTIRLKPYQIGIAFYWPDGRDEHAVYDVRALWQGIVNPPPKQLSLWAEVQP